MKLSTYYIMCWSLFLLIETNSVFLLFMVFSFRNYVSVCFQTTLLGPLLLICQYSILHFPHWVYTTPPFSLLLPLSYTELTLHRYTHCHKESNVTEWPLGQETEGKKRQKQKQDTHTSVLMYVWEGWQLSWGKLLMVSMTDTQRYCRDKAIRERYFSK